MMPPDLLPTLIGSNHPSLELIFMVPKVFELLKFDCTKQTKKESELVAAIQVTILLETVYTRT